MANERLKAFKQKLIDEPEYAERIKANYKERLKTDTVLAERRKAKQSRSNSLQKSRRLNTAERAEAHTKWKTNRFKISIMEEEELREHRRKWRREWHTNYRATHGLTHTTVIKWQRISGLTDIEEVKKYRENYYANELAKAKEKKNKPIIPEIKANAADHQRKWRMTASSKILRNQDALWQELQRKISNLNCVISIESIRNKKIEELKQNFYNQHGYM